MSAHKKTPADFVPKFDPRAERARILGLAGALHDMLSAANRDTLTLGQIRAALEKAEILSAAILSADVEITVTP